ncbi:MAG: hypothetical protein K0B14_19815 [Anaerolineaceae bacterium]|nr:hypothetical protein [Anaerolineaceae bacterium]
MAFSRLTSVFHPPYFPKKCAPNSGITVRHAPESLCALFRIHCAASTGFCNLVEMDKQFINTYVLVKLDVYREQLFIYVEPDQDGQELVMEKHLPLYFAKMRY